MNIEQMRIRMGEMAAEIDRLNAELTATTISWENALAELDKAQAEAIPTSVDAAIAKLKAAQICHDRAVQVLIEEALDLLSAAPTPDAGGAT